MTEQQKQIMIRIVSITSWVFAALCLAVVVFIMPSFSDASQPNIKLLITVFSALAVIYGLIGWGLGKFKIWAAILALIIYGLNFISNIFAVKVSPVAIVGVITALAAVVLIILGRKTLKK